MNFKKAMKIWAHLCDYTSDCNMCILRDFCRAEPCTLGEIEISIMQSILEKHNEKMLMSKYKKYMEDEI